MPAEDGVSGTGGSGEHAWQGFRVAVSHRAPGHASAGRSTKQPLHAEPAWIVQSEDEVRPGQHAIPPGPVGSVEDQFGVGADGGDPRPLF